MSDREVFNFLPSININQLIPDIPEFRGLTPLTDYRDPDFPVYVCTVFILVLGVTVIILRIIVKRISPKKQVEGKESHTSSRITEVQEEPPKPKPRWKKPTIQPKEGSKKITGLKPREESANIEEVEEEPRGTPRLAGLRKVEPKEQKIESKIETKKKKSAMYSIKREEKKIEAIRDSPKVFSKLKKDTSSSSVQKEDLVEDKSAKMAVNIETKDKVMLELDSTVQDISADSKQYDVAENTEEEAKTLNIPAYYTEERVEQAKHEEQEESESKKDQSNDTQAEEKEETKRGWFSWKSDQKVAKDETDNQKKTLKPKSKPLDESKPIRTFHLNIDEDHRPPEESKKAKQEQLDLLRTMGREFRELIKLDEAGAEAKEDRRKEMEKVKSARMYFKAVDQQRAEAPSPTSRFRVEEENLEGTGLSVGDLNLVKRRSNFYQSTDGSTSRLSQFEPGKLNKSFTNVFENGSSDSQEKFRAPKKKLISLDQVLRKDSDPGQDEKSQRAQELEQVKEARKSWVPPDKHEARPEPKEDLPKVTKDGVKKRWQASTDKQTEDGSAVHKSEVAAELSTIRDARPTPVTKRWKHAQKKDDLPVRSKSAHALHRSRLPDDSWVLEKSHGVEEEKRRAAMELEMVRRAREEHDQENIYDFTTKRMDERRTEALQELEAVRNLRKSRLAEDDVEDKVDAREIRNRELEALIALRRTEVKETFTESQGTSVQIPRSSSASETTSRPQSNIASSWAAKTQGKSKESKVDQEAKIKPAKENESALDKSGIKNIFKKNLEKKVADDSKAGQAATEKTMKAKEAESVKKPTTVEKPKVDHEMPVKQPAVESIQLASVFKSKGSELTESSKAATAKISKAFSSETKAEIKAKVSKVFEKSVNEEESKTQSSDGVTSSYKKMVQSAKDRLCSPDRIDKDKGTKDDSKTTESSEVKGERESAYDKFVKTAKERFHSPDDKEGQTKDSNEGASEKTANTMSAYSKLVKTAKERLHSPEKPTSPDGKEVKSKDSNEDATEKTAHTKFAYSKLVKTAKERLHSPEKPTSPDGKEVKSKDSNEDATEKTAHTKFAYSKLVKTAKESLHSPEKADNPDQSKLTVDKPESAKRESSYSRLIKTAKERFQSQDESGGKDNENADKSRPTGEGRESAYDKFVKSAKERLHSPEKAGGQSSEKSKETKTATDTTTTAENRESAYSKFVKTAKERLHSPEKPIGQTDQKLDTSSEPAVNKESSYSKFVKTAKERLHSPEKPASKADDKSKQTEDGSTNRESAYDKFVKSAKERLHSQERPGSLPSKPSEESASATRESAYSKLVKTAKERLHSPDKHSSTEMKDDKQEAEKKDSSYSKFIKSAKERIHSPERPGSSQQKSSSETEEKSSMYSKVIKSAKGRLHSPDSKATQKESKAVEFKQVTETNIEKQEKSTDYSKIFKSAKESVAPKETIVTKKSDEKNKIDFTDIEKLKFEKCDLKSKDNSFVKYPATRVVNCTPRPFSRASLDENLDTTKVTNMNVYEDVERVQTPVANLLKPAAFNKKTETEIAATTVGDDKITFASTTTSIANAFTKKESEKKEVAYFDQKTASVSQVEEPKISTYVPEVKVAEKPAKVEESKEDDKNATKAESRADKKIKKFLKSSTMQKKEEKVEVKASSSTTIKDLMDTLPKAQESPVAENNNKVEKKRKGGIRSKEKEENRLSVRFKELKEKTVTEVTKMTRGRSVQRGTPITREGAEIPERNVRARSESRSQKAGRLVKDFTSTILNKRR